MTTSENLTNAAREYLTAHNKWEDAFDPMYYTFMDYQIKEGNFSEYDKDRPYLVRAVSDGGILLWLPETDYSFEQEISISRDFMDDPAKFHAELDQRLEDERLANNQYYRQQAKERVKELEEQLEAAKIQAGMA